MRRLRLTPALFAAIFAMGVGSTVHADEAKCQDGVAKGSRNVGNQEQKKNRKCVKDGAGDIDGCVNAEAAKAAIKRGTLIGLYASGGKCDPVALVGVDSDPNDIADHTEDSAGDILRKVFGDPVDGIVAGDKCQDRIAKRGGKKFDTELKAFRSCIKDAAPAMNQAAIDGCIATGVNDAKAQSTVQPKLQADMASQCTFPVPAGMDDGNCSGCTSATTCATCVGDIVDCEACEAMNGSSNSFVNCDLLDDGNANSSCPPPCPGGQVVGGFCWFLGALGQDCDDACASHGLTYSAATQTYAGSGGSATLANCQTVMTALGEGTTFIDFGSCFDGFGCARNVPVSQYYRCTNIPTNSTAVHPTGERACACQ